MEALQQPITAEGTKDPQGNIRQTTQTPEMTGRGFMDAGPDYPSICRNFSYNGSKFTLGVEGQFVPLSEGKVAKHLRRMGLKAKDVDEAICYITTKHFVEWIGPMAGYPTGIHVDPDSGRKILVTRPPTIIEAAAGEWELIRRIAQGLFQDVDHGDQFEVVMGWVKTARENVKRGVRRPLPALAIVGPINCGKSLFLEIIRIALGGRSAPAYRALTNDNGFNADILGAELLTVDDQMASRDRSSRVRFGQAIKSTLFASTIRVEEKHQNAFSARPVHALALALNDEPQHVQVLPEMDPSLSDKISLISAGRAGFLPGEADDREGLMEQIRRELPSFLLWLENWDIPEHLKHPRTGVCAWQHPVVMGMLAEISPEERFLELLRQNKGVQEQITTNGGSWRCTSAQIEKALMEDNGTRSSARALTNWHGAIGTYLRRHIAKGSPEVQEGGQRQGIQTWILMGREAHI